jgi:hypothetical protein
VKSFKPILSALVLTLPLAAAGSALITVKGKLTSITEADYLVETPSTVYYINRHKLTRDQVETIKGPDTEVALAVAPEAIDLVKTRPEAAKPKH